jgi:hypothetical protein
MSPAEDRAAVRSYQRIFRPDRRLYAVEGHRLPVPGGVPLRWLGHAAVALLAIVVLSGRSPLASAALAAGVAIVALGYGSRATALTAAVATFSASQVAGYMLATIDWPLRLLILPAALATLATQAAPDGRSAHRYARTWLATQLRPERRTLGRPVHHAETVASLSSRIPVASDAHGRLRRSRVRGPALVRFARPVHLRARRGSGTRSVGLRPAARSRAVVRVDVAAGERLEVRP